MQGVLISKRILPNSNIKKNEKHIKKTPFTKLLKKLQHLHSSCFSKALSTCAQSERKKDRRNSHTAPEWHTLWGTHVGKVMELRQWFWLKEFLAAGKENTLLFCFLNIQIQICREQNFTTAELHLEFLPWYKERVTWWRVFLSPGLIGSFRQRKNIQLVFLGRIL